MRNWRMSGIVLLALLTPVSRAGDPGTVAVGRELGSVLAWRLGPGAVEAACRDIDPDGAEARQKSLKAWLEKNAKLIQQVDERVAEVVPLIRPTSGDVGVQALHRQVTKILLEPVDLAYCKEVADPANSLWTNNGMPHVVAGLAELYDWKVQRESK